MSNLLAFSGKVDKDARISILIISNQLALNGKRDFEAHNLNRKF